jgi:hypothetical protein
LGNIFEVWPSWKSEKSEVLEDFGMNYKNLQIFKNVFCFDTPLIDITDFFIVNLVREAEPKHHKDELRYA